MSINILIPDDGEFAVKINGQLSIKKARALHSQVMRIHEEDEHPGEEDLREGVNPKDTFTFLPVVDLFSFTAAGSLFEKLTVLIQTNNIVYLLDEWKNNIAPYFIGCNSSHSLHARCFSGEQKTEYRKEN